MRMISFSLTTPQFLDRTKDVTRRTAWQTLTPGTILRAVEKAMGLKKGEKVKTLGYVQITNVRRERLDAILSEPNGAAREGFPHLTEQEFVEMFCRHQGCEPSTVITRIEFTHTETPMTTETPELETPTEEVKEPKSKGAKRKRRAPRTLEQQAADKAKKEAMAAEAEKSKPKVDGKRAIVEGKQTRIAGTADPVPQEVSDLANQYADTLHAWQSKKNEMTVLKDKLMAAMKRHDIVHIETDDSYIDYTQEEKEKISVKLKGEDD